MKNLFFLFTNLLFKCKDKVPIKLGTQLRLNTFKTVFPELEQISKHLLERIWISFNKNPNNPDEKMTYTQFLKFYKIIISQ